MKILHLSLKQKPFEVMKSGEKLLEFRRPSKWICSRLMNGFIFRKYDYIKFTNGYGNERPCFLARHKSTKIATYSYTVNYSNGLTIDVEPGDYVIEFELIDLK